MKRQLSIGLIVIGIGSIIGSACDVSGGGCDSMYSDCSSSGGGGGDYWGGGGGGGDDWGGGGGGGGDDDWGGGGGGGDDWGGGGGGGDWGGGGGGGGGDWGGGGGGGGGDWGGGGGGGGGDDGYCDGTGFCYKSGNSTAGRDTVAEVGEQEAARIATAGKNFAAKFHLSEATGLNVAKAFYDYKELSKKRTRTQADVQKFTERMYGLEMSRITSAITEMEKGNMGPMNSAIDDAADHWGTTPETMKEVLSDWYKDYLPTAVKKVPTPEPSK